MRRMMFFGLFLILCAAKNTLHVPRSLGWDVWIVSHDITCPQPAMQQNGTCKWDVIVAWTKPYGVKGYVTLRDPWGHSDSENLPETAEYGSSTLTITYAEPFQCLADNHCPEDVPFTAVIMDQFFFEKATDFWDMIHEGGCDHDSPCD